jgi:hypothetical protein
VREHVGRSWKLVVLVAAGLGVLAFFEPFIEIPIDLPTAPRTMQLSAYRVLVGFDDIGQFDPALRQLPVRKQREALAELNDSLAQEIVTQGDLYRVHASRIPHCFLSVLLLLAVAAVALARRELGLLGSLFAIGGGLGATYAWSRVLSLARHTQAAGGVPSHLLWGGAVMAAAGALGLLAGIGSMLWPDPGGFRSPRTITVQLEGDDDEVRLPIPTGRRAARMPKATLRSPRDED